MQSIVLFYLVAVAVAAPQAQPPIAIISQENEINPDGSYAWSFQSENGINEQERGSLKNIGAEEPALQVEGQFSYPSEDGSPIQVSYIANENGFQPSGPHLPTPPPIPEAIQRALSYLATAPPQSEN